jgi:hypothetical protein
LFCRKFPKATDNGFIYIYKSPFIANTKDTAESDALRSILLCKYQSTAEALSPKSITHVGRLGIFHTEYGYWRTRTAHSIPQISKNPVPGRAYTFQRLLAKCFAN